LRKHSPNGLVKQEGGGEKAAKGEGELQTRNRPLCELKSTTFRMVRKLSEDKAWERSTLAKPIRLTEITEVSFFCFDAGSKEREKCV